MSDANDNIIDQPSDAPRSRDVTNDRLPRDMDETERRAAPPQSSKTWLYVLFAVGGVGVAGVLVLCLVGVVLALIIGLMVPAVNKVRQAAARAQSTNNLKMIGLAMFSCSDVYGGQLPQSYGPFPPGNGVKSGSYFYHLLPYLEQQFAYDSPGDIPVKEFIAPGDPRNPGTNSTISYCSNGTVFANNPNMPRTFIHGTSNTICVMERSGMDGAHKWTNAYNVLGTPGNPPQFPQIDVAPATYVDGSPQGFSSAGCAVLMGDASVRIIAAQQPSTWNWACDPTNISPAPPDW